MLIRIRKDINLAGVEQLYKSLDTGISIKAKIDVIIPSELEANYLGIIPALIQFISTWLRYENSNMLLLDIEDPTHADITELYKNELIFPVVGLVWNHNGVYDRNGNSLRKIMTEMQNKVISDMKQVKVDYGETMMLTNFDHLSKEKGLLPCFEKNGAFISNEEDLLESLKAALEYILRNYAESKKEFKKIEKDVVGIIFELMKNTFEWAKDNEFGVPYDPNIRGILIKNIKKTRSVLLDQYGDVEFIKSYFNSNVFKENTLGQIYFMEISVFDSGAGFIKKYRSYNNADNYDDMEILKRCLIKHNTSAQSLDKGNKGLGLDRILQILDKRGFLRIRTGSKSLFRDLIRDNHKNVILNNASEMILYDWNRLDKNGTPSDAAGSVVTIIYPLQIN